MSEQNMNNIEQNAQENTNKKSAGQKAQGAKQKMDKAKKIANKAKRIKGLSSIVAAASWIMIILLIIIILVGFIAFFLTMPGLMIDRFLQACKDFWKDYIVGDESIEVKDEQMVSLANYIEDLGYDLHAFGFANNASITRDGSSGKGKIKGLDLAIGDAEAISRRIILNEIEQINSDAMQLYTNNGEPVMTKYILTDASIIKDNGSDGKRETRYYRFADETGKNLSFYNENDNNSKVKFTGKYDEEGIPRHREYKNGKDIDSYDSILLAISYNDFKKIRGDINRAERERILKGQKKLIQQLLTFMTLYKNQGNDESNLSEMLNIMSDILPVVQQSEESKKKNNKYAQYAQATLDYRKENAGDQMIEFALDKDDNYKTLDNLMLSMYKSIGDLAQIQSKLITANAGASRPNLFSYVLANERTYTAQGVKQNAAEAILGWIPIIGDFTITVTEAGQDIMKALFPQGYGMIVFPNNAWNFTEESAKKGDFNVNINREDNTLSIITGGIGAFGIKNEMKWNLAGWTARYGKPIELSLALHLSTMAPDFVNDFCMNGSLQTKVYMKTQKVQYEVKYSYITATDKTVYKDNTTDSATGKVTEGVIKRYEKYKSSSEVRKRAEALFNKDISLVCDRVANDNNEYENKPYMDTYPIEILTDTSIISLKDNDTGVKKYYKAVDRDKNPVPFFYSAWTGISNISGGYYYNVNLNEDGEPYFETDPGGFYTKDLYKNPDPTKPKGTYSVNILRR